MINEFQEIYEKDIYYKNEINNLVISRYIYHNQFKWVVKIHFLICMYQCIPEV